MICTSALHLYLLTRRNHVSFEGALAQGIGSAIAFALSILVIWPVTALLVYHLRVSVIRGTRGNMMETSLQLLFLNITTIEQVSMSVTIREVSCADGDP